MELLTGEEVVSKAISLLHKIYGPSAPNPIRAGNELKDIK
jgi:hypothetical protein